MNYLGVVVCLAVAFAVTEAGKCTSSKECGVGQCCVGFPVFWGKFCKNILKEDESCFPQTGEKKDVYFLTCPCEDGLDCVSKVVESSTSSPSSSSSSSSSEETAYVCSRPTTEEHDVTEEAVIETLEPEIEIGTEKEEEPEENIV